MTLNELQHLIADGEHDTREFKRSTGQRSRAMETLCAMLIHCGGRVVFIPEPNGLIHRSPGQRPGNAVTHHEWHAEGVRHPFPRNDADRDARTVTVTFLPALMVPVTGEVRRWRVGRKYGQIR